jgi:hypothetical protein
MQELSKSIHPLARRFAQALIDGNFDQARQVLSDELAEEYTADLLQETFEGLTVYEDGKLTRIDDESVTMAEWPDKQPGDVVWNYVSLSGESDAADGFCMVEAVTVVIAKIDGREFIREIEWGRP